MRGKSHHQQRWRTEGGMMEKVSFQTLLLRSPEQSLFPATLQELRQSLGRDLRQVTQWLRLTYPVLPFACPQDPTLSSTAAPPPLSIIYEILSPLLLPSLTFSLPAPSQAHPCR